MHNLWEWILTVTGTHIPAGQYSSWYNFWSGFGADLVYVGAIATLYKNHKCTSCWRLAHHHVEGTPHKTCHIHATSDHHATLHAKHAEKHPKQHEFLNKDRYEH